MNILVTGGASGLGKSITKLLAADNENRIYFTYNSSQAEAENLQKEFSNCTGLKCDFSDLDEVKNLGARFSELELDILINNAFAGSIPQVHFHKERTDVFLNGFTRNVLPVIELSGAAISVFRKRKSGKIITILSSVVVNKPPIGWSDYTAQKNYLHSLAKSWAIENAAFNITSNCVSPGFMQTNLTSETDERILEQLVKQHPLKKLLTTAETAEAVKFLVYSSSQINGINMIINAAGDVI